MHSVVIPNSQPIGRLVPYRATRHLSRSSDRPMGCLFRGPSIIPMEYCDPLYVLPQPLISHVQAFAASLCSHFRRHKLGAPLEAYNNLLTRLQMHIVSLQAYYRDRRCLLTRLRTLIDKKTKQLVLHRLDLLKYQPCGPSPFALVVMSIIALRIRYQ